MVAVSMSCSLPSVDQNSSRAIDTAASRFCGPVIGPSALSSRCTASLPPAIASASGGSSQRTRKYSTIDITTAQGAPAISHWIQLTRSPSSLSMKPTVRRFCAAAVCMPTFQTLVAIATVIMMPAAMFERRSTPKARMTPIMIGTTQALRAVALGTTSDRRIVTTMLPIRMRRVLVPMVESVTSAMRRSSPVMVMAAAMHSAAPTSASAVLENPASAMPRAGPVP